MAARGTPVSEEIQDLVAEAGDVLLQLLGRNRRVSTRGTCSLAGMA